MTELLEFARGPLFLATFLFMIVGCTRLVVLRTREVFQVLSRTPKKDVPWRNVMSSSAEWIMPVRHLFGQVPVLSIASVAFHVGLIVTPVFLAAHVYLWSDALGFAIPVLSSSAADVLTISTLVAMTILFGVRTFRPAARKLSRVSDYLLILLFGILFLSGYFATHVESAPLPYTTLMLIHVMAGNLLFVLVPTTKLAHVVLFPFARLSGDLFWRLVPGAGDQVAEALRGSNEGAEI